MGTGKFQGKPYSNILLGRISSYLENILLGAIMHWYKLNSRIGTPYNRVYYNGVAPENGTFLKVKYFKG